MSKEIINPNIDITKIMKMIPHRYPFLLIDKVLKIEDNNKITGIKNITFNEPQFMGHFPENPIMPGVLIIEAIAQLSAILVAYNFDTTANDKEVYFMSIDNAKFRKIVRPGDSLLIESTITQNKGNVWKFNASAKVDDVIVAEANIMAMVKNL